MRARAQLVGCSLLAACGAGQVTLDRPLAAGDRVVVVSRADDVAAARAGLFAADEAGRLSVSRAEGERLAFAILRQDSVVAIGGDPAPWAEATVALDGDDGPCGCRAPDIGGGRQMIGPGDRCTLPRDVALELTPSGPEDDALVASLRERLRVVWPGACACPHAPLATEAKIDVCPLGDSAERQQPDRIALAEDGTVVALTRGMVTHLLPDGRSREHPLTPATEWPLHVAMQPNGDAVTLAQRHLTLRRESDLRLLPRQGSGPPIVLEGAPRDLIVEGISWDDARSVVWIFGRVGNDISRRPGFARCRVDASAGAVACNSQLLPVEPRCPQHTGEPSLMADAPLAGGDRMWVTSTGAPVFFSAARDGVVCVPEAETMTVQLPSGERVSVEAEQLTSIGRRVVACVVNGRVPQAVVAVLTATVGAIDGRTLPRVRWETAAQRQGGLVRCGEPFTDPARPGRIFQPFTWGPSNAQVIVELGEDAATLIDHRGAGALYPGVGDATLEFASSSSGVAAVTPRGEVLVLGGAQPVARTSLGGLGAASAVDVRAIRATALGNFEVDLGGAAPLSIEVRAREGCDAVARVVPPGALDVQPVTASGALGDAVLRGIVTVDGPFLERSGDPPTRLPLSAPATRVRELVDGRWAVILDEAGALWATDGAQLTPLDASTTWVDVDAMSGVGWAVSRTEVARILVDGPGGPRLEHVLSGIDRGPIEARHDVDGYVVTAVRAQCGGRALFGARGEPFDHDNDVTTWTLAPREGGLVLEASLLLADTEQRRGQGSPVIVGFGGLDRLSVAVFGEGFLPVSAAIVVPGAPAGALPFAEIRAIASSGADVLVGGVNGRLALVRVR